MALPFSASTIRAAAGPFLSDSNKLGARYHAGIQCAAGGLDDGDEFVSGSGFVVEGFVGSQSGYRVVSQAVL